MASSRQLIDVVAAQFAANPFLIENYYRQLRQDGMVSNIGKGSSSAKMTERDAAALLGSCCGATFKRVNATKTWLLYRDLVARPTKRGIREASPELSACLLMPHTLEEAMIRLISTAMRDGIDLTTGIVVEFHGPWAEARIRITQPQDVFEQTYLPLRQAAGWRDLRQTRAFSDATIRAVGQLLRDPAACLEAA